MSSCIHEVPNCSNDGRLKFILLKIHMAYVVFMSLWPRTIKILTQADLGR